MRFPILGLTLCTLPFLVSVVEAAEKYPHGIEQPAAALAAVNANHRPYQFHKRQDNSTMTTSTGPPKTTDGPTTSSVSNLTTSSTKFTATTTNEDGGIETFTSTRVVVPTGDGGEMETSTTTGPPTLQTGGGGMALNIGGAQIAALAGAAAFGAWMI